VKTTIDGVYACRWCSIQSPIKVQEEASQNVLSIFMEANCKNKAVGTV
jgi:hypothetical protein